jgi:putative flavoprotein involved in K+ transport
MSAADQPSGTGVVDALVIGAGHSGLATSHFLSGLGVEHLILERGEVANSWRNERWDSLRLLTPNWQATLPGYKYDGDEPDDFMDMPEVVRFIEGYAAQAAAPIHTGTTVTSVQALDGAYRVQTDAGEWRARSVVIASGGFNTAVVPACSEAVPDHIRQLTAHDYRNPDQLDQGGVLVVGASATGLQIAEEIHGSGRPVTLAVGEHVRLPRVYRGRDIQWWMDRVGVLDERYDEVDDLVRARNVPSPQLIGSPQRKTLDLNSLTDKGVRLVGRLAGVRDGKAQFSGGLRNVCALADLKMNRLLNEIDEWLEEADEVPEAGPPVRFDATRVAERPVLGVDLAGSEISSILWATGFRPDYSWLALPVLDRKGLIRHDGGVVTGAPGLYLLGLPFLRRRKSSFIHGAEDDARDITRHLFGYLNETSRCNGRAEPVACRS